MTPEHPKSEAIPTLYKLRPEALAPGRIHRLQVSLIEDGCGRDVAVPVLVARGSSKGPSLGLTAVVHGNELNGIPVIQRLMANLDMSKLRGTLIAVPVVNVPGYQENRRDFRDGQDLNRIMPGKETGNESEVYAFRFVNRIVSCFEYLIDLHTASFGRANSLYVRANMQQDVAATMARLIGPQIIVHNEGQDGTLRDAAASRGIHAITVEVGDPNRFQRGMIRSSRQGVQAVLEHLNMMPPSSYPPGDSDDASEPCIECARSYWIYTHRGGVLDVFPQLTDSVKRGQKIATIRSVFGEVIEEYHAPEDGIVVAKSTNPVAHTGSRILHLGIVDR